MDAAPRPAPRIRHRRSLVAALLALVAGPAVALVHPAAFLAEHEPSAADFSPDAQIHCLALNIYHEARNEPTESRVAVAMVTLNRVRSPRFPNTLCRVVWQPGQFSWTHDGRPDRPYNLQAWREAVRIAEAVLWWTPSSPLMRATHYHAVYTHPGWASKMRLLGRVGRHLLYVRD